METSPSRTHRSAGGLRAFDAVLRILVVVLWIGTALLVPLSVLVLTGHGSMTLDATVVAPYAVRFADGRSIAVDGSGLEFRRFPRRGEGRFINTAPTVRVKAKVDRDDTDTRAVGIAAAGALLALSWLVLVNLRRLVRSVRAGDPFGARNALRLRFVGIAVLTVPVVTWAATLVLNATLDFDIPIHITSPGPSAWVFLTAGIGLLALSEIFREGTELQALERSTI